MKSVNLLLFFCVFASIFLTLGIYAQEENANAASGEDIPVEVPENTPASSAGYVSPEGDVVSASTESAIEEKKFEELVKEAEEFDEELEVNAGLTPDSPIYFVDGVFDNFASEENLRQERIAEMRELAPQCGQGDEKACEYVRESFENYKEHADKFGEEVSPEQEEEALRSSQAIRGVAIREIAQNLPPEQRNEFVREIVFAEKDIATAAEIAGKIKELCETLSKLDPLEYSRVCRTNEDTPEWQQTLDKELTEGQRQEAKLFGDVMSECFKTNGQQCRCEEIPFTDFAETCSIAAPLVTACEIENNEEACEQLDDLEMPELPEHLQEVFDSLEGNIRESQFEVHLPPECKEANTRNANQCVEIMFRQNAPGPCLNALDRGEISFTNEREAREACEKIMFEENAPQECIEKGLTDFRECGKLIFQLNAPQECIGAGLTGENRGDEKKCKAIMESQGRGPQGQGPPASGVRCREIQNSEERLKCYDSMTQGVGERVERVEMEKRQVQEYRQEGGQKCPDNICDEFEQTHPYACPVDCGGSIEESQQPQQEFQQPQEFQPPEGEFVPPEEFNEPIPQGEIQPSTTTTEPEPTPSETTTTTSGTDSTATNTGITGAVVDDFYRYYFG